MVLLHRVVLSRVQVGLPRNAQSSNPFLFPNFQWPNQPPRHRGRKPPLKRVCFRFLATLIFCDSIPLRFFFCAAVSPPITSSASTSSARPRLVVKSGGFANNVVSRASTTPGRNGSPDPGQVWNRNRRKFDYSKNQGTGSLHFPSQLFNQSPRKT